MSDKAIRFFREKKADAIVPGCTELPFVITDDEVNGMQIIDSTRVMAKAIIREVIYCEKC